MFYRKYMGSAIVVALNKGAARTVTNGNTWCIDVPFDASRDGPIAYKYFVRSASGLDRENVLPRVRMVPTQGNRRFRDDWSVQLPS